MSLKDRLNQKINEGRSPARALAQEFARELREAPETVKRDLLEKEAQCSDTPTEEQAQSLAKRILNVREAMTFLHRLYMTADQNSLKAELAKLVEQEDEAALSRVGSGLLDLQERIPIALKALATLHIARKMGVNLYDTTEEMAANIGDTPEESERLRQLEQQSATRSRRMQERANDILTEGGHPLQWP
jgi:hypothetical protein